MPILKLEEVNKDVSWGLWEITETLEDLLKECGEEKDLLKELEDIRSMELRLEKAATRICLKKLLEMHSLEYKGIWRDDCRKPHLKDLEGHISFSHSFPYVGVSYDLREPSGIDIQDIQQKILRIAPRFMSAKELQFAGDSPEACTVIWCVKETLPCMCLFMT